MKNSGGSNISKDERRRNLIPGLAVGAALGVVFWSALDGLLPVPLDFLVGMATGLLIGYSMDKRPSILMRYPTFIVRRLLLAGAALLLGMFAYLYILGQPISGVMLRFSSLLAIVPAIGFILSIGSAIAHLDEMQRRIQTGAIAFAFAGTAIVVIVYSFLGWAGVPSPNWGWLVVAMTFMWMLGKLFMVWRYR